MNFSQRLTFLFSAPMFDADDLEGLRVNQIISAIERLGFQVIGDTRLDAMLLVIRANHIARGIDETKRVFMQRKVD